MDRDTAYVSSIPVEAKEKVTGRNDNGSPTRTEYYIKRELVGLRLYHPSGEISDEYAFRNGQKHGWSYRWDHPGELLSAENYEDGLPHGTAYQWRSDGTLLGSYTLEHGTGIDLWWETWSDGDENLAEVHYLKDGAPHGFDWWLDANEKSVWWESHWQTGVQHGIERQWNGKAHLRRGYPRYWIQGERVTKAKYQRAAAKDPRMPPFRAEENRPERMFPPEIACHLRRRE